jgi:hypothetical protein
MLGAATGRLGLGTWEAGRRDGQGEDGPWPAGGRRAPWLLAGLLGAAGGRPVGGVPVHWPLWPVPLPPLVGGGRRRRPGPHGQE